MHRVELSNKNVHFRHESAVNTNEMTLAHDLKDVTHDESWISFKWIVSSDYSQHADIKIFENFHHNLANDIRRISNALEKQITTNKNAILVNYERVRIKSCNQCIISKTVDMQVYKR